MGTAYIDYLYMISKHAKDLFLQKGIYLLTLTMCNCLSKNKLCQKLALQQNHAKFMVGHTNKSLA